MEFLDSRCGEKDGAGVTAGIAVDNGKILGLSGPGCPTGGGLLTLALSGLLSLIGGNVDLGPDLVEATFLERLNRFAARVKVEGGDVLAHVANSGRMRELFVPGIRVWLKRKPGNHRKTGYDLCLVDLGFALVSADAGCRMPWLPKPWPTESCPSSPTIPRSNRNRPTGRAGWTFFYKTLRKRERPASSTWKPSQ